MLKKITLRNFKSFRDCTFELAPLTFITGANAVGKSNFFDALRFLQGLTRSLTVNEILSGKWQGGQQVWPSMRGEAEEVFNLSNEKKAFEIITDWELENFGIACKSSYQLQVQADSEKLAITRERWVVDGEEYDSPIASNKHDNSLSNFDFIGALAAVPEKVRTGALILRESIQDLFFLAPLPALMRDYVSKGRQNIGIHGENLSAVLFKLVSNPGQHRTVLDWIREFCSQEINDFHFFSTELNEVLLAIKEPNGVIVSARSMSDGTLRFLSIIVAMLNAQEGTTFLIEEIDNSVHPSRFHLLTSFLEQISASRKLQVIASTHSSYWLDWLDENTLKHVLVFHRDIQSAETRVTKLVDIPGFPEARKNMSLDLMHASGWMEQNL